jgi:hypothetical protein
MQEVLMHAIVMLLFLLGILISFGILNFRSHTRFARRLQREMLAQVNHERS